MATLGGLAALLAAPNGPTGEKVMVALTHEGTSRQPPAIPKALGSPWKH